MFKDLKSAGSNLEDTWSNNIHYVNGELASKVTFSAAYAEKIASTGSAVRNIFAKKPLIELAIKSFVRFYNVKFCPLVSPGTDFSA